MRTPVLDVFRPAMYLASKAYFRLRLRGIENIPAEGPLLITPNHQTYADPPLVTIPVRRPVHYMAWDALFEIPVLSWAIRRLRAFPVALEGADPKGVRQAVRLLEAGEAVMIFPEGGRSVDGRLQRFKLGAFRLAVAQGAAVLPVTIVGGNESWPPTRTLPRPGRITITYHPVLRVDPDDDPKVAARRLADRARAAIASALPPDRTG
ncbi:MAG: 1-acyl-sn-glycerol-3-phosphate acyltransferase [Candidatus Rokuibacteriota bacterium]|nr:MAG: 1-acyl-sn-glycerol-3-phosphate acyltransferase [Candidatus Rokubacteria bacterium]